MIESFALDAYTWVLTTDIWVDVASYLFVFSILFNSTNTIVVFLIFLITWMGWEIENSDFLQKLQKYNKFHADSLTILGVIGTFLGLSMAFYSINPESSLSRESSNAILSQMQYVFISSLFGYSLGTYYSGMLIAFFFNKLIEKFEMKKDIQSMKNHTDSKMINKAPKTILRNASINLTPCKTRQI